MKKSLVLIAVLAALLSAGCGGADDGGAVRADARTSSTAPADHNQADLAFAKGMLPHHEQAVEMADLALKNSQSAQVKGLANRIRVAQKPEIVSLQSWLDAWGAKKPSGMSGMDDPGNMSSADGGGMGMMDDGGMRKLSAASGSDFDRMFLTSMVEHHKGAITMAKAELADGRYQPAKTLAKAIVDSQSAEITEMEGLLGAAGE